MYWVSIFFVFVQEMSTFNILFLIIFQFINTQIISEWMVYNTTYPMCCGIIGQYNDIIYLLVYGGFWRINASLPINPSTIQNNWVSTNVTNLELALNVATVVDNLIYFYQKQSSIFGYFDMKSESYTLLPFDDTFDESPVTIVNAPCVTHSQGNIILIGGDNENENGNNPQSQTIFLNLEPLQFRLGPTLQRPRFSFGCTPFEYKNGGIFLYVFGGFNSQNTIEKINITDVSSNVLNTQTWDIINQEPTSYNNLERAGIQIIVHLQKIYLLGGFSAFGCEGNQCEFRSLNYVDAFNPYDDSIVNISGLNHPKYGSIYGVINNRIYSFGGMWFPNSTGNSTSWSNLEVTNIITASPSALPSNVPTTSPTNTPTAFNNIKSNMPTNSPTNAPTNPIIDQTTSQTGISTTYSDNKPPNRFSQQMPWIITGIVAGLCLSMCIVLVSFCIYMHKRNSSNNDIKDIEIIHERNINEPNNINKVNHQHSELSRTAESMYDPQLTISPQTKGLNMYNGNIHNIIQNNRGNILIKHGEPSPAMSVSVNRIKKEGIISPKNINYINNNNDNNILFENEYNDNMDNNDDIITNTSNITGNV